MKPRLFFNKDIGELEEISFTDKYTLGIGRVLRLKRGDKLEIFTRKNQRVLGRVEFMLPKELKVKIEQKINITKSTLSVTVIQAICKSKKMEFILEKATELDVSRILPFYSQKSLVAIDDIPKKMVRWEKTIIQAIRQSERPTFPELRDPMKLENILENEKNNRYDLRLILDPSSTCHIRELANLKPEKVSAIIGPEEGLTIEEIKLANKYGYRNVRISLNTLRVETAVISFLSVVDCLWGN